MTRAEAAMKVARAALVAFMYDLNAPLNGATAQQLRDCVSHALDDIERTIEELSAYD